MKIITLKVPIMGEAGVGKTSLANFLSGGHFPEEYKSTIGVDIFVRIMQRRNTVYRIQFWDLAGQKKFSFLRKIFYRGSHAALFVFDLTRRETFEQLEGWIEDFRMAYPNVPILIVGNKKDLEMDRKVSYEEAERLARKFGTIYIETSVKQGLNVHKAFEMLLSMVRTRLSSISL